jgi:hypothetical protein
MLLLILAPTLAIRPFPLPLPLDGRDVYWHWNRTPYIAERFPELASRIRYLKIDVEGFDYQVLESLKSLISNTKPFIKVEVFKLLNFTQRERLYDLLVKLGYEVFMAESDATYLGPRLAKEHLMIRRHYNAFCVPKS